MTIDSIELSTARFPSPQTGGSVLGMLCPSLDHGTCGRGELLRGIYPQSDGVYCTDL